MNDMKGKEIYKCENRKKINLFFKPKLGVNHLYSRVEAG